MATEAGQVYLEGSTRQITINSYERNPQARAVCPNCHAMLHRRLDGVYTIEEIKALLVGKQDR
ncbi:MAG: hypothetical protein IT328_15450 [Caldilineaceae bacterium]|nr:hypothetical protein [Caldilineaceae bacterium]